MPIDFKGSLLLSCKVHAYDFLLFALLRFRYQADFGLRQLILSYYYIINLTIIKVKKKMHFIIV